MIEIIKVILEAFAIGFMVWGLIHVLDGIRYQERNYGWKLIVIGWIFEISSILVEAFGRMMGRLF